MMTFVSGKCKIVCRGHEEFLEIRDKYFAHVAKDSWKLMKVVA